MKIAALVLALAAVVCAVPTNSRPDETGYDIDNMALLSSALVLVNRNGGNVTETIDIVVPYLMYDNLDFSKQIQMNVLNSAGLTHTESMRILTELLPLLKRDGKTTQEQVLSILLAVNQFCRKTKDTSGHCPEDEQTVLPLIAMTTERGCEANDIVSEADELPEGEMCVCEEQTDIMFWVSLFNQFSKKNITTKLPDQLPGLIMMVLDEATCEGTLKQSRASCSCSNITSGHEATLFQYLITSPALQELLSPEQRKALKAAVGTPALRQSLTIDNYIFSALAKVTSPQLLSLFTNNGQDSSALIRQMILSSIGLDSSMVHILLNGGFNDGNNKVAMINYLTNLGFIDSSILPLLLGVDNGRDFYFSSLLNSGSIDPLMGMILLASQSGASSTQLLEYITTAVSGSQDPNYFTSLGRPYVPVLPSGVYPGSQLYFAHFESLGVNTCALHDLRTRFDCGYIGISAAECETAPYCCYNPVFLTDIEVRNATDGQITTAIAIPWCYYNVFYIYFNSYYMPVKRPGEFASPIECLPLFKYGLQFDKNLYHLYDPSNPTNGIGRFIYERRECGFPGITEFQCIAIRGCCWDGDSPYRLAQCYVKNGPSQFNINYNTIPEAYKPTYGQCNINTYQIPLLYYFRTPCHYPIDYLAYGYDLLSLPNQLDCLTKLGCCWEQNDEIASNYPMAARCYQREGGQGANVVPTGLPTAAQLIAYRAGDGSQSPGDLFNDNGYPSVKP